MNLVAKIAFTPDGRAVANRKSENIKIDRGAVCDGDDVIQYIEEELYDKYGTSLYYSEHFEIKNYSELCEELAN